MQRRAVRPDRARRLRATPTAAELRLWRHLRQKQLEGFRFRRQVPIGPYIADFACIERSLIIEVDGGQHSWNEAADDRRTEWLNAHGWQVVRYWNNEVMENIEGVLTHLVGVLCAGGEVPHPVPPPQAGEGEVYGLGEATP
jgi:very-short-patch-repair endonuclease